MNRAVMVKTWREHGLLFGLVFAAAVIFPILLIVALSSAPTDAVQQWLKWPLVRNFLRMFTGADPESLLSRTGFAAFSFVHPVTLSVCWAFLVVSCSGVLSGEIDRGTVDHLLSLPLTRWGLYRSISGAIFLLLPLLAIAPWLGACASQWFKTWDTPLHRGQLFLAVVNGLAAYTAVACVGLAISAAVSRRGIAVGLMVGGLISSFLLNVLGVLWEPAERVAFLGLLYYYQPLVIVRDGHLNGTHMAVLIGVAVIAWTTGGILFARRDICTT